MNAIRKLLLAATAAVTLVLPLAGAPEAKAGCGYAHVRVYSLYYRSCPCDAWHWYGQTTDYNQLITHSAWLQSLGYEVYAGSL